MLDDLTSLVISKLCDVGHTVDGHKNNRFGRKTNMYRYTVTSPKGKIYKLFFNSMQIVIGYDCPKVLNYEDFNIDRFILIFEN